MFNSAPVEVTAVPEYVRLPVPTVTPPARVTSAPLKVAAVVVPDLIIKSPLLFVALPNVVPASLKKISSPSASSTISAGVSNVIAPDEVPTVTDASPVDRLSEAKLASV